MDSAGKASVEQLTWDVLRLRRLRDVIQQRTGLYFPDGKLSEIKGALAAVASETPDLDQDVLLAKLDGPQGARHGLFDRLVSHLTVKETHLFRTPSDFVLLREHILPELIERRRDTTRKMHLWSCGCATGEEAYSLAIVLLDLLADVDSWDLMVLGTDIDAEALRTAREGLYGSWSFRGVPEDIIRHCFKPQGDFFRVNDRYHKIVKFRQLNLADDRFPSAQTGTLDIDIILCRNTLIYFQPKTIVEVSSRLHDCLAEDGYLVVGHVEHGAEFHPRFQQEILADTYVYRKGKGQSAPIPRPNRNMKAAFSQIPPADAAPQPPATPARCRESSLPKAEAQATVDFSALLLEAQQAYREGNYQMAARSFMDCFAGRPDYKTALLLARCQANLGNLADATHWCEEAVRLGPLDVESNYFRAVLHINQGRLLEAIDSLRKTIYLDPNVILAYFELGNCHKILGQCEQAKKAYEIVVQLLAILDDGAEFSLSEGIVAGQLKRAVANELSIVELERGIGKIRD